MSTELYSEVCFIDYPFTLRFGANNYGIGVVAVGWNGYLSYLNQAAQTTVIPATQPVEIPAAPKARAVVQKPLVSFKPVVALV